MDDKDNENILDDPFSENEGTNVDVTSSNVGPGTTKPLVAHHPLVQNNEPPANTSNVGLPQQLLFGDMLQLVEQPNHVMRFRYKSDKTPAGGLIYGVSSTPGNRTPITIRIKYTGYILVIISCVDEEGFRAHPNMLATYEPSKDKISGICMFSANVVGTAEYKFEKLGITITPRKEIAEVLKLRQKVRLGDPFRRGFAHAEEPKAINTKAVRLAIQVREYNPRTKSSTLLTCVTSDVIRHDKVLKDPEIIHHSISSVSVSGGPDIFMFCKWFTQDAEVYFYEANSANEVIWSRTVKPWFIGTDGCIVETPQYDNPNYDPETHTEPIKVWFCILRTGTRKFSNPRPLEYLPTPGAKTKRKCMDPIWQNISNQLPICNNRDFYAEACKSFSKHREDLPNPAEPVQSPAPTVHGSPLSTPDQYQSLARNQPSTSTGPNFDAVPISDSKTIQNLQYNQLFTSSRLDIDTSAEKAEVTFKTNHSLAYNQLYLTPEHKQKALLFSTPETNQNPYNELNTSPGPNLDFLPFSSSDSHLCESPTSYEPCTSYQNPAYDPVSQYHKDSISNEVPTQVDTPGPSLAVKQTPTPHSNLAKNKVDETQAENAMSVTAYNLTCNQDLVDAFSPTRNLLGDMFINLSTNDESSAMNHSHNEL